MDSKLTYDIEENLDIFCNRVKDDWFNDEYIGAISKHECVVETSFVIELLEEVKRLRRVIEDIESMIPDNHEEVSPTLSDILNECHRVLPMFNEMIE